MAFPPSDVFKIVGRLNAGNGAPRGHGFVAMVNGYLLVIFASDSGGGNGSGGFAFFDISDPRAPVNVFTTHNHPDYGPGPNYAGEIREPHAFSFSGQYACIPTRRGLQFWDFSQVGPPANRPLKVGEITQLPGVTGGDYSPTPWWVCWQGGRYVYVAGTSTGLHIVDASNPANPVLIDRGPGLPNPIPKSLTGGFQVGTAFAVGNLLVITGNDTTGMATLDISDPAHPVLLNVHGSSPGYSAMMNGDRILGIGDPLRVYSIAANGAIALLSAAPDSGGKGGYGVVQDDFVHMGSSSNYSKINIATPGSYQVAGKVFPADGNTDLDFGTSIGHLAFVGDDHGVAASYISPHQAEPDTTPPVVNMVHPRDGALSQALTSRVGLTFTDQIDIRSVNVDTFIVRPVGGAVLPGTYSQQTGIVNFWPASPLEQDTTYEIVVPAGGVRDFAGNAVAARFTSYFSTGSAIVNFTCQINATIPAQVHQPVTLSVAACSGAGPFAYSWDFGDGTVTPFSSEPSATHTWSAPGRYTVIVTVENAAGRRAFSATQTIRNPATPLPPSRACSIVFDAVRNRVWCTNPDANTVTAIDAQALTRTFEVPVGHNPRTLAMAPDGTLWVTNQDDGSISVLHATGGQQVATIALPYGSRPSGIAFAPGGEAGFVTLEGTGWLLKLDPPSRSVTGQVHAFPNARGLAISHDGQRAYVTRFISPANRGEVLEVDTATMSARRLIPLEADPGPDQEDGGRGIPNYLLSVSITPDGQRAWVTSKKDNTLRGAYRTGEPLTFESTVRALVAQIDLVGGSEELAARRDLNDRALPSDVVFSPEGDFGFVATLASNTVDVFDAWSGEPITSMVDVGMAPMGLAISPEGHRLFVHNYMSRDVSVYDVSDMGLGNSATRLTAIPTVENELLAPNVLLGKQIFYNAADNRMCRDNYISCAVCHLDGDSDGRVWDFTDRGEGLRNTTALQGRAGMGHGPVHWSANFDEIQDFEHDVRNGFAGSGFMSDTDFNTGTRNTPLGDSKAGLSSELDALAAYVASLDRLRSSPYRNPDGSMTAEARAGAVWFHSAETGCAGCHRSNLLTDSHLLRDPFALHDVGTISEGSGERLGAALIGLDTPTLKGVWDTPPYLHDGSAESLHDVIVTRNPEDRHGRTSHLTELQRGQLVAYLQQLDNVSPGDFDADDDVDQSDFGAFQICLSGPTVPQFDPDCGSARLDADSDVDQDDLTLFRAAQLGADLDPPLMEDGS
jgi:DNA-binding beta-propeller fold protein YncE